MPSFELLFLSQTTSLRIKIVQDLCNHVTWDVNIVLEFKQMPHFPVTRQVTRPLHYFLDYVLYFFLTSPSLISFHKPPFKRSYIHAYIMLYTSQKTDDHIILVPEMEIAFN